MWLLCWRVLFSVFFFNDTATTEIYTLSLHDALPILAHEQQLHHRAGDHRESGTLPGNRECHRDEVSGYAQGPHRGAEQAGAGDRKSTRLNSSHANISYAVFCLKKKKSNYTRLKSIYI